MAWTLLSIAAVVANILFSIVIVLLNKQLVVAYRFKFMTILAGLHFCTGFIMCLMFVLFGVSKYKAVNNYLSVFRIALGSLLSVIFMNYCLSFSTVGFYQVIKLFCIPLALFFEYVLGMQQEVLNLKLVLSLLLIIAGMAMIIREEISANFTGILWGLCGIITTSLSQIYFGPLKKGLGLDATQLLLHTSPWLTVGSFISVPVFENIDALRDYKLTSTVFFMVLLTCLVAVGLNVTNYVLLSEFSPLTYNIIGHLKTILIISVGSIVFKTLPSGTMLVGMTVAIVGVVLFNNEKEAQQELKKNALLYSAVAADEPAAQMVKAQPL